MNPCKLFLIILFSLFVGKAAYAGTICSKIFNENLSSLSLNGRVANKIQNRQSRIEKLTDTGLRKIERLVLNKKDLSALRSIEKRINLLTDGGQRLEKILVNKEVLKSELRKLSIYEKSTDYELERYVTILSGSNLFYPSEVFLINTKQRLAFIITDKVRIEFGGDTHLNWVINSAEALYNQKFLLSLVDEQKNIPVQKNQSFERVENRIIKEAVNSVDWSVDDLVFIKTLHGRFQTELRNINTNRALTEAKLQELVADLELYIKQNPNKFRSNLQRHEIYRVLNKATVMSSEFALFCINNLAIKENTSAIESLESVMWLKSIFQTFKTDGNKPLLRLKEQLIDLRQTNT